ncbi:hypothetical protein HDU91_004213, partial [Kappamyces sp. JEL0680]
SIPLEESQRPSASTPGIDAESIASSSSSLDHQDSASPLADGEAFSPAAPPQAAKQKKKKKKRKFKLAPPGFFSMFFMAWIVRLIRMCLKIPDIKNIIFQLLPSETAQETGDTLCSKWELEVKRWENRQAKGSPSLFRALMSSFGWQYAPLGVWKLMWVGFTWIGNYYSFSLLLAFVQSRQDSNPEPQWHGHLYALGLFFSSFFGSLCFHHLTIHCTRIGIRCRAALMVMIYRKSLRLSYVKGGV